MGSIITTVACCSGSIGENNVDEEVEDTLTIAEKVENNDEEPHMKTPYIVQQSVLPRSWSETTTIQAR
jgi:hypothetical protein